MVYFVKHKAKVYKVLARDEKDAAIRFCHNSLRWVTGVVESDKTSDGYTVFRIYFDRYMESSSCEVWPDVLQTLASLRPDNSMNADRPAV